MEGKHISKPPVAINARVAHFNCPTMIATLLCSAVETVAVTS